jgi:phosphoribosylaminoimidazole-succinocarboxamide synthase
VPNHLTGRGPGKLSVVPDDERQQVRGRSPCWSSASRPLPIEAVVRGYLAGSGLEGIPGQGQSVCGVPLAGWADQRRASCPAPIFTPATKAEMGAHDENISFAQTEALIGAARAAEVREVAIRLYETAAAYALSRGIIIADTKFEFGLDAQDRLVLMDEVLTPDSSRYWPVEGYQAALAAGANPPSYDKQFVRDWLEAQPWNKKAPAPQLPAEVVAQTAATYAQALQRLGA